MTEILVVRAGTKLAFGDGALIPVADDDPRAYFVAWADMVFVDGRVAFVGGKPAAGPSAVAVRAE